MTDLLSDIWVVPGGPPVALEPPSVTGPPAVLAPARAPPAFGATRPSWRGR